MARKALTTFVLTAALAAGALAVTQCSRVRDGVSGKVADAVSAKPAVLRDPRVTPDPSSEKLTLKLVGVVDGDTIHVLDADGKKESVRFIGIDAPESSKTRRKYVEMCGVQAKEHMVSLLSGSGTVTLEFDAPQGKSDKYGRLLAYVWAENGECLNYRMVADGFAWEYTYHAPYRLQAAFRQAQSDARQGNLGLWAPEPKGCGGVRKPVAGSVVLEKPAHQQ